MRDQNGMLILTLITALICSLTMLGSVYAAGPETATQAGARAAVDVEPPLIDHMPFSKLQKPNVAITLQATITDNHGIQSALLNYRVKGMENYRVIMMRLSESDPSKFTATIPAGEVGNESIEYYIQATDTGGNTVLRGGMLFPLSIAFIQAPPTGQQGSFASNRPGTVQTSGLFDLPTNSNQSWAWIAGGVLVGVLIANIDDSEPGPGPTGGTISVTGPSVER